MRGENKRKGAKRAVPALPEVGGTGADHLRPSGVYDKVVIEADATPARSSRQTGQEAPMIPRRKRPLAFATPSILIVDDDEIVARSWANWFRSKFPTRPVVLASNLTQARAALAHTPMLAILLDVGLDEEDGLDLLRELRANGDSTHVMVVTGHSTEPGTREAARLGAATYPKPTDHDDIITFVQNAIDRPHAPAIAARLLAIEGGLTTEQAEVFLAMLVRDSTQNIADALDIGIGTAKAHVGQVLEKLGATSRIELLQKVLARMSGGPRRLAKQA